MSDAFFVGDSYSGKTEWLTPPSLVQKLGKFDLDPCSPINSFYRIANSFYTEKDNGLIQEWKGRVFCNPPYDYLTMNSFIKKCLDYQNAILLIFARTDTAIFQDYIFKKAHSILFLKGRIKFYHNTGEEAKSGAGAGSCLIACNEENTKSLSKANKDFNLGTLIIL